MRLSAKNCRCSLTDINIVSLYLYPLSRLLRKNTSEIDTLIAGYNLNNILVSLLLSSVIKSALYVT